MHARSAALALGLLSLLGGPALAADGWYEDFDAAVEAARKGGKDLLVDFTGSDWCGWCIRLKKEVFGHEEFTTAAGKGYVLVALDYPRSEEAKAKVPNPTRNDELRKKYEIRGYPTVLLMNVDGEVFASTGYRQGGVEAYLEHMEQIGTAGRTALKQTNEIVKDFDKAKGKAKAALWERAVGVLETLDSSSPFAPRLANVVRYAFEVDPKNESGMKLRAVKALLHSGQADDAARMAARELDPKNKHGLLEQVVQGQFRSVRDNETAREAVSALDALVPLGFVDREIGFDLHFTAARWLLGPLESPELGRKHAQAALELGSSNAQMVEACEKLLED